MNVLDVRKLVSKALESVEEIDSTFPLGNVVYTTIGEQEFEVIIRTVRPGWNDRETKQGPLAQQ